MSVKDKLEIGLKPGAAYRRDNLPDFQKDDPDCRKAAEPGESLEIEKVREKCADGNPTATQSRARNERDTGRRRDEEKR
jgi:hypothetical protein